jgi:hypothetical protein
MGGDNRFNKADIEALKKQPFITAVAPLISNQFRAKASAGNILPFSTDLFLESIDDEFIDTLPPGFKWQPGQVDVPIIFSSDYLEIYNVFAPAQELPQLSQATIQSVNITLECFSPLGIQSFRGHIVGLSDRINSILVPKSFLTWANLHYGNSENPEASRLYLKTNDANNADLLNYLQQKDYRVNKDKTKFGRVKQVLQAVWYGRIFCFGDTAGYAAVFFLPAAHDCPQQRQFAIVGYARLFSSMAGENGITKMGSCVCHYYFNCVGNNTNISFNFQAGHF